MIERPTIHASCVVVGEAGVLIRGVSGAGKSSLSAELIARAAAAGAFARLVADDRVRLRASHGRLLASVPAEIAGLIERRGLGVFATAHLATAVVRLVVDIEPTVERLPDMAALACILERVALPRIMVAHGDPQAADLAILLLKSGLRGGHCGALALAFASQEGKIPSSASSSPTVRSGRAGVARGVRLERNEFCAETA